MTCAVELIARSPIFIVEAFGSRVEGHRDLVNRFPQNLGNGLEAHKAIEIRIHIRASELPSRPRFLRFSVKGKDIGSLIKVPRNSKRR